MVTHIICLLLAVHADKSMIKQLTDALLRTTINMSDSEQLLVFTPVAVFACHHESGAFADRKFAIAVSENIKKADSICKCNFTSLKKVSNGLFISISRKPGERK